MPAAQFAVARRRSASVIPPVSLSLLALLLPLAGCPRKTSNAISATASGLTANPTTGVVANGTDSTAVTVVVIGTDGKPLAGQQVLLSVTGTANNWSPLPPTDADGLTTTALTSTVAETKTISASANGVELSATATVVFIAAPPVATQLAFTVQPSNAVAGGVITPAVQVAAEDVNGNVVTGATTSITLTLGPNSPAGSLGGTAAQAATAGVATFTGLSIDQVGTGFTLVASAAGLTSATSSAFNVSAGSLSATNTTLTASPASAPADGSTMVTLTATAKDAEMNPIAGVAVSLSSTGGSSDLFGASDGATNATGVFTTTLTSTLAESDVITATIGGQSFTTVVQFTAGALSNATSSLTATPTIVPANGTSTTTLTVIAKDQFGNGLSGQTVTLTASGTGNVFSNGTGTIAADGQFTSTLASTVVQTEVITATVGGTAIATPATVTFTGAGTPTKIEVAPTTTPETTGTQASTTTLEVLVLDANSLPVSGVQVSWASISGGGSITPTSVTTGANGTASATATLGTVLNEVDTFTATAAGLTGSPVTFGIIVVTGPAATLKVAPGGSTTFTGLVNATEVLMVEAVDANNNPVAGVPVSWSEPTPNGTGDKIVSSTTTTASNGQATATVDLGSAAANLQFQAASGSLTGSPVTFTITVNPQPPVTLTVDPTSAVTGTAGGMVTLVVDADSNGAPAGGIPLTWSTSSGGSVTQASTTTGVDGTSSETVILGAAGTEIFTVNMTGNSAESVTFTVSVSAGPPTLISVASGNNQTGASGAALSAPFLVAVTDSAGDPLSGVEVDWKAVTGSGSVSQAQTTTGTGGTASITATLGALGANTFSATIDSDRSAVVTFSATATAGAPAKIVASAGNAQTGAAGAELARQLTALVTDANNNPVSNVTVDWATAGFGSVSADHSNFASTVQTTSGASGSTSIWVTLGTTVGSETFTATIASVQSAVATFTETVTSGPAAQIAIAAGDGQTAVDGTQLPTALSVLVTDAESNPVKGAQVDWSAASGGTLSTSPASPQASSQSSTTDVTGTATIWATLGGAPDTYTFSATLHAVPTQKVTFSETATLGPPSLITITSGNGQSGAVASELVGVLTVTVTDASLNPIANATVDWTGLAAGSTVSFDNETFSPSTQSTTGSNGQTYVWAVLGTTVGAQSFTANIDQTTASVTFSETAVAGSPAQISIGRGNNQTGGVGTELPTALTVLVTDSYNNPVAGAVVDWSVVESDAVLSLSANSETGPSQNVTTDGTGTAAIYVTLGVTLGQDEIEASLDAAPGTDVIFTETTAAGPPATLTVVNGIDQEQTVGTQLSSQLTVQVVDVDGNPIQGASIVWTTSGGTVSVDGSTWRSTVTTSSDVNGQASVYATLGTTAGTQSFTASVTGTSLTATITAIADPGDPAAITATAGNGQSGLMGADLTTPLTVFVADSYGNAVPYVTVDWSAVAGGGEIAPDNISWDTSTSTTTDATGRTVVWATLGATPGADTFLALVDSDPSLSVTFTETALAVTTTITITAGNAQTGGAGAELTNVFTVRVTENGAPIQNLLIDWVSLTGGGTVAQDNSSWGSTAQSTTDSTGQASVFVTLGTTPGTDTFTATIDGDAGASVTFSATVTAGAPTQITISSGDQQTGTVGTALSAPLVVFVTDSYGNAVSHTQVDWTVPTGSAESVSAASSLTDSSGLASITATLGATVGADTFTAIIASDSSATAVFSATATVGAAADITINSGNAQSGVVSTELAQPLIATVTDAEGNALSQVLVDWSALGSGGAQGRVSADDTTFGATASVQTDDSGDATIWVTLGSALGTESFVAAIESDPSATVTFTETVTAGPPNAISVIAGAGQSGTVGTDLPSQVTVAVVDASRNPVSGALIDWAPASAGLGLVSSDGTTYGSSAQSTTDVNGQASIRVQLGATAGTETFLVSVDSNSSVATTFSETGLTGAATVITKSGGDLQSGAVDSELTNPLTVLVTDAAQNPIQGVTIDWAAPAAGSISSNGSSGWTTSALQITTDATGTATLWVMLGDTPGTETFQASIDTDPTAQVTFTETVTAGPPADIVAYSGLSQSGTVGAELASQLVVFVTDANANPAPGTVIDWTALTGDGTVSPSNSSGGTGTAQSTTDAQGYASIYATLGTAAGDYTFQAAIDTDSTATATFTAVATAASPTLISPYSGTNQSGTVGTELSNVLVALVTDANANPVQGARVDWSSTSVGAEFSANNSPGTSTLSVQTDENGYATVSATLGAAPGTDTFVAAIHSDPSQTASFTATASVGPPTVIVVSGGNNQTGFTTFELPVQLSVLVKDNEGNLLPGVMVDWAPASGSEGTLSSDNTTWSTFAQSTTGATGSATVWATLGADPGADTFVASIDSDQSSTVTFTEAAVSPTSLRLSVVGGNNQTGTVGTQLASPLTVLVTDASSVPLSGLVVDWAVTGSAGSVAADQQSWATTATSTTDANGHATIYVQLGTMQGTETFLAAVDIDPGAQATFTETAAAGAPYAITVVAATNNQSGTAGAELASELAVVVTDSDGNLLSGIKIAWSTTSGGTVSADGSPPATTATSLTDATGTASVSAYLGAAAGTDTYQAVVDSDQTLTTSFTATALAGAPTVISVTSGSSQTAIVGTTVSNPLVATVTDSELNPISNVTVDWAVVGGSEGQLSTDDSTWLSSFEQQTDVNGQVTVYALLGANPGADSFTATIDGTTTAVTFTEKANAAEPAVITPTGGTGQSGPPASELATQLTVNVTDGVNALSGIQIDWASAGAGLGTVSADDVTFNPTVSSTTDANGNASVWVTLGTAAGVEAFTATVDSNSALSASFTETVLVGRATQLAGTQGNGQTAAAGTALPTAFIAQVTDSYGNAVSGVVVDWSIATGGGSISSDNSTWTTSTLKVSSDANGNTTVYATLGDTPGLNTFLAAIDAQPSVSVTFGATATVGSPTLITKTAGDSQSAVEGSSLPTQLSVLVTDAVGNVVSGALVDFMTSDGSLSPDDATWTQTLQVYTDVFGTASAWAQLGQSLGPQTFQATIDTDPAATVTFHETATAGPATSINATSGNSQSAPVGTELPGQLVATVTDSFGHVLSGVSVDWSTLVTGASISTDNTTWETSLSVRTDSNGNVAVWANLGSPLGAQAFVATIAGDSSATATFTEVATAGAPNTITPIGRTSLSGTVGTELASQLVVELTDAGENPTPGATVDWSSVGGAVSTDNSTFTTSVQSTTDANGKSAVWVTLPSAPGTYTFVAVIDSDPSQKATFTVVASDGPPTLIGPSGNGGNSQSAAVGTELPQQLTALVTDASGNPLSSVTVDWAPSPTSSGATVSSDNVTFTTAASSGTDSNGNATVWVKLGDVVGSYTITASIDVYPSAQSTFTATATAGSAALISATGGQGLSAPAGTELASQLTATVTDTFGNPASGVLVDWSTGTGTVSTDNSNWSTTAQVTTDQTGNASIWVTLGTALGTDTFVAELHSSPSVSVTFSETATAGAPANIVAITGGGQSGTVGSELATQLEVEVVDSLNDPLSGVAVEWTVPASEGTVSPDNVNWLQTTQTTTDANGLARVWATLATAPGTWTYTAAVATNLTITTGFSETAQTGSAAKILPSSGQGEAGTVGTELGTPIVAVVEDSFGNPIAGTLVDWKSSDGATISATGTSWGTTASSQTDGNGLATLYVTLGTTPGQESIVAAIDASPTTTTTFFVQAQLGPPSALVIQGGNAQAAPVGTELPTELTVQLQDDEGNALAGVTIDWTPLTGTVSVDNSTWAATASTVTDGNGLAGVWARFGTTAGTDNVVAAVDGDTSVSVTFTETVQPGIPTALNQSGNNQSGVYGQPLSSPLVVTVVDAAGNPVPGTQIDWLSTGGGGSISPDGSTWSTSLQVTSDSNGNATVYAELGAYPATLDTWSATVDSRTSLTVTFTAGAASGPASSIEIPLTGSGNQQTAVVATELSDELVVLVTDSYGNPVSGAVVSWFVESPGETLSSDNANFLTSAQSTTDSNGRAGIWAVIGTIVGDNQFQAGLAAITSATVTFDATATPGAPSSIAVTFGNQQTDSAGQPLPNQLSVLVEDLYGNVVPGVQIDWSVVSGGGSVAADDLTWTATASSITDATGMAIMYAELGPAPGPNEFEAVVDSNSAIFTTFSETGQ